jgi:hypothetical protein
MKSIYNLPLKIQEIQHLNLEKGTKILTAKLVGDVVYVWFLVEHIPTEADWERKYFYMYEEGPLDVAVGVDNTYLTTVQLGSRFLHIFVGNEGAEIVKSLVSGEELK